MRTILAGMKRVKPIILFAVAIVLCSVTARVSADWLTLPGQYTHDAMSGQRVAQYAPVELPTAEVSPPLRTSGYTHYRSSLAYGQSADHYHRVEQWGDPVRPYGEWRFPFRPYSTPYPNWGAPFAGLNINNGLGFGIGFGGGYPPPAGAPVAPVGGMVPPAAGHPGLGHPGLGHPGLGHPGHGWQPPNPAAGTDGFAPYPAGRGTPYPVAPYYDGYTPNYRD
jgi:hypothetical protein